MKQFFKGSQLCAMYCYLVTLNSNSELEDGFENTMVGMVGHKVKIQSQQTPKVGMVGHKVKIQSQQIPFLPGSSSWKNKLFVV